MSKQDDVQIETANYAPPLSSDSESNGEKGHFEEVNLQNNTSAKYVFIPLSSCPTLTNGLPQ